MKFLNLLLQKANAYQPMLFIGFSSIFKLLSGFVIIKILAVNFIGLEFSQIGLFISLVPLVIFISSGGVNVGLSKLVSSDGEGFYLNNFLHGFFYSCIFSFSLILFLIFFGEDLLYFIGFKENANYLKFILIVLLPLLALNNVANGVLNGFGSYRLVSFYNISSSVIALLLYFLLMNAPNGVYLASVLAPSLAALLLVVIFILVLKRNNVSNLNLAIIRPDKIINLFKYSLLSAYSLLTVSVALWVVKSLVVSKLHYVESNSWEAVSKIAESYFLFCNIYLSSYFFGKIVSFQKNERAIYESGKQARFFIFSIYFLGLCTFLFFKEFFISLIFSKDFIISSSVFAFFISGELFKLLAYSYGYQIIAKGRLKLGFLLDSIQGVLILIFPLCYIYYYDSLTLLSFLYFLVFIIYFFIIRYVYESHCAYEK